MFYGGSLGYLQFLQPGCPLSNFGAQSLWRGWGVQDLSIRGLHSTAEFHGSSDMAICHDWQHSWVPSSGDSPGPQDFWGQNMSKSSQWNGLMKGSHTDRSQTHTILNIAMVRKALDQNKKYINRSVHQRTWSRTPAKFKLHALDMESQHAWRQTWQTPPILHILHILPRVSIEEKHGRTSVPKKITPHVCFTWPDCSWRCTKTWQKKKRKFS